MLDELGASTDLSTANQPAGTTKIDNGIAYDVSGKSLGPANVPADSDESPQPKGDDFFEKLGGQPVQAPAQQAAAGDKSDDFFAKLGGQPVRASGEQVPQTQ